MRVAARRGLDLLITLGVTAAALVALTGGIEIGDLSARGTRNAGLAVVALLAARRLLDRREGLDTVPAVAWIARGIERLRPWARARAGRLAGAAIALYAAVLGAIALRRHAVFASDAFDLGIFDQLVWRASRGSELYSSILERPFFGEHLSPVLWLLGPLYRLWAAPEALLLLQTLVLAAGAVPVYLLARDRLGSPNWGLALAVAYLGYAPLRGINLFDFHLVSLAVPALLFAWLALERGRPGLAVLAVLVAVATREDAALAAAALGLYLAIFGRRKRMGWALAIAAGAYFLAAVFFIVPAYRGSPYVFLGRYPFLEAIFGEVPPPPGIAFETAPGTIELHDRLIYLLEIFGPFALLPLAAGPVLLLTLPGLVQSLTSATPAQLSVESHYPALVLPFVVIAAIEALARLQAASGPAPGRASRLMRALGLLSPPGERPAGRGGALPGRAARLAAWLVVGTVLFAGRGPASRWRDLEPPTSAPELAEAMARVPADVSVSAQSALVPHLSRRDEIYLFPSPRRAAYVLLDAATDRWPLDDARYLAEARALLRLGYGVVWHSKSVVLLAAEPGPEARRNLPGRFIRATGAGPHADEPRPQRRAK